MSAVASQLMAKSTGRLTTPTGPATLPGHLAATADSMTAIGDASLGSQLRAFQLPPETWEPVARRILTAAALWHDLGKANDHFLRMLAGQRQPPQGLRHEAVSLLLALHPALREWLRPAFSGDEEWHLFLWAVSGHHRKDWLNLPPEGSGTTLTVYTSHPDFASCLTQVAAALDFLPPPALPGDHALNLLTSGAPAALSSYFRKAALFFEELPADWRKFAALLKASLIAADVAASSQITPGKPNPIASLSRVAIPAHLEAIAATKLGANSPREFQLAVANTPGRVVLVEAGCGTGKTLAAYLRAARHPDWRERRLCFCYPTTGTATEGFRGYLFDSDTREPSPGAALFHSRSAIDSALILGQPGDDDGEPLARASALDLWDTPITVCTVDTVLGLLQNQRAGHYLWPAIANGAFVFDEIHAYDDQLFGTLLRFLRDLRGLPVLLMTASLPAPRLDAIRHVLAHCGETLPIISGPVEIETIPRYLHPTESPQPSPRTLHVSNTVARCMAAARSVQAAGHTPLVYHSRFKYRDRVERHKAVIAGFDPKTPAPAHACTTQVCEMSLDLSARLLITDLAPIPALIQRLGRLNRHDPRGPLPFQVIEPGGHLPYSAAELDLARQWLAALGSRPLSQQDLISAWETLPAAALDLSQHTCSWLDGGPLTLPATVREGAANLTLLMEEDLAEARAHPAKLAELLLPMPPHRDSPSWSRHRFIPIAPAGSLDYDEYFGAAWKP